MKTKRQEIFNKYKGHCAYCGCRLKTNTMTIDHLKPQSNGGTSDIDNLMPACRSCNATKADGDIELLRIALAWPTLNVTQLQSFQKVRKAAKKYKFYFEN